eukprot:TRINITY_DN2949_c0_g1_i1.p1 TRINITY_DN2949_c0_g1~~TRINITY_DN2949_c0_g1_i1.p1  ORF type:complete len:307 (+),score=84.03 TRINITY_DN2949_c0_g1_i1:41-922(+)
MSVKALGLAKKILSQQLPPNSKVLEKTFVSPRDASSFGFVNPKNVDFANSLFTDLNQKERVLQEKKDSLLKSLGPYVPWSFYENHISDAQAVDDARALYNSIFEEGSRVPAIAPFKEDKTTELTLAADRPQLIGQIESRIDALRSQIETDVNPFLNPFADFWVYEMDGPEFAEVFAARPKWNDMINTASENFAFNFTTQDPLLSSDIQESWNRQVEEAVEDFQPIEQDLDLVEAIAAGRTSDQILGHYTQNSLVPHEQHLLEEWTHEDNASLAMRNGYVSTEVDPMGKHFGGH